MHYRAIGFDYGGVLVSLWPLMQDVSAILDVPVEELRKIFFENNTLINIDHVPYHEFWQIILRKLHKEKKSEEVAKYITAVLKQTSTIDQNMLALLDRLRSLQFKVGILSNNSREGAAKMREEGFEKRVDVCMISVEVGHQKPSPEIFQLFTQKLGVRADELIFIDDSKQSLLCAKEIGFYPILFTSYDNLVTELTSLGVLSTKSLK